MKKLLFIFLLIGLHASATHFTCPLTGSPAHPVLTSMAGHSPGDTCLIPAGTYTAGFNFSNLNGIIILPMLGAGTTAPFWTTTGVYYSGQSYLLNNKYVTFRYQVGTAISGDWITFDATHNEYMTISNIAGYNITGAMFRGDGTFPYTYGDTTTFQMYMWNVDSITEFQCGMVLHCGFGDMSQNHPHPNNVSDSVVIKNVASIGTTATTEEGTEVRAAGLFRGDFHNWAVTSTTQRGPSGDDGLFYIKGGNCIVYNIYKWGGPGYILRIYGLAEISHPRDVYGYNLGKFNSTEYGLMDFRWDNTMLISGATQSCGFDLSYCTFVNGGESIGYWSSLAVIGTVDPARIGRVRNCVACNLKTNGKPFIGMDQSGTTWSNDTANNQYWASATLAKLDSITAAVTNSLGSFPRFQPTPTSTGAILHGGTTISYVTSDYLGAALRSPSDLGYIQLPTTDHYYISSAGSDAADGLTPATAWQTIAKVNATTFSPGDSIFFRRGDTFFGTLRISQSGLAANKIHYGSYGSGANAIIGGFNTVGSWTNLGGNLWESSSAISTLPLANVVSIAGSNKAMGRYPNTSGGYIQYQNHVGNTQITTSSLTGTPNYTGGEIVLRPVQWIIARDSITAQSFGTLTYIKGTGLPYLNGQDYNGANNWGFFIQNMLQVVDTLHEWYYNRSTKKITVYEIGTPPTVQVSAVDTLVSIIQHDYITFDQLQFIGANSHAVFLTKAKGVEFKGCNFDFNYDVVKGLNFGASNSGQYFVFKNDTVNHTNNHAIDIQFEFTNDTITNNIVLNTGALVGMGGSGDGKYQGINATGVGTYIAFNTVDSSGYVAIGSKGSSITITKNYITNYCFLKDDGGGIYVQQAGTGNEISYNTVINGIGALNGTANGFPGGNGLTAAYGIYLDDLSAGWLVKGNNVSTNSASGIYLHNTANNQVIYNTVYNNNKAALHINDNAATTRTGLVIKNNIFFQKDSIGKNNYRNLCVDITSAYNDLASILTMDSNYFARPIDDSLVFDIDPTTSGGSHHLYTLSGWQALYGFDTHSHKSPIAVTTTSDLRFDYNPSGSSLPVSLGFNYIDVTGVNYNGTITLNPYSSAALIKFAALPTPSPSTYSTIFNHSRKLP